MSAAQFFYRLALTLNVWLAPNEVVRAIRREHRDRVRFEHKWNKKLGGDRS